VPPDEPEVVVVPVTDGHERPPEQRPDGKPPFVLVLDVLGSHRAG
jgi:hypothetical protein